MGAMRWSWLRRLVGGGVPWWQMLFELVLIGVVVYLCLRFLRGTRGARLLSGVIVVLVGSALVVRVLADTFQLERIQLLYSHMVPAMLLVALVVFQPELRRGLMRLGQTPRLGGWLGQMNPVVDQICRSVAYLSKNKIGAVIAIERRVGLLAVAESGYRLDAAVTAELLNTIFWPGSALHDMGVIIRRGRVLAARCQFPLAEAGEAGSELGSRHRAALGLSNESDALVIVVSEETGTISVAEHGQLTRGLDVPQLRGVLLSGLDVTVAEEIADESETTRPMEGP